MICFSQTFDVWQYMFCDPQTFIFLQETSFEQCQFQIIISKNLILCRKQKFDHHFEVCVDQIFEVCATQNFWQISNNWLIQMFEIWVYTLFSPKCKCKSSTIVKHKGAFIPLKIAIPFGCSNILRFVECFVIYNSSCNCLNFCNTQIVRQNISFW